MARKTAAERKAEEEAAAAAKANANGPRPYVVLEELLEGGVGTGTFRVCGTYDATTPEKAMSAAATDGEPDGKERTGNFMAATASSVKGKSFVKQMQPAVTASEFKPWETPPAPAPANGSGAPDAARDAARKAAEAVA